MHFSSLTARRFLYGSVLALLILLLAACGSSGGSIPQTQTAGQPGASPSTVGTKSTPVLQVGQVNPGVVHLKTNPLFMIFGKDGNFWGFGPDSEIDRIALDGTITTFNAPSGILTAATNGPDGNIWFTEGNAGIIGKITPDGTITPFSLSAPSAQPQGITAGPDGNLWFTVSTGTGYAIGRITTSGTVTTFPLAIRTSAADIVAGKDGNLWFTEDTFEPGAYKLGRITPSGTITEFPLATPASPGKTFALGNLVAGPDGNLWLLNPDGAHIDRVTPQGTFTEFPLPAPPAIGEIIAGPDGNVWFFGGDAGKVERITPDGTITEFDIASSFNFHMLPAWLCTGPDNNVWFFDQAYMIVGDIGYISTGK